MLVCLSSAHGRAVGIMFKGGCVWQEAHFVSARKRMILAPLLM
jgi:hypothetical protein